MTHPFALEEFDALRQQRLQQHQMTTGWISQQSGNRTMGKGRARAHRSISAG